MKITEIDSHEKACRLLGKDPMESTNIHDQLDDIADAINKIDGDYIADFNNPSQKKWRPLFIVDASGFRFGLSLCGFSDSYSYVGSRLCQYFRSKESSDYFGKTFFPMHEKCFNKKRPVPGAPTNYKELNTHSDACKVLGKDPAQSNNTDQQITDIFNAANKLTGFKVDFNNPSQKKWRPFFIMDASGFRFGFSFYAYSDSYSTVGSRLCHYVGSEEEANHLGIRFLDLHKAHYLGE